MRGPSSSEGQQLTVLGFAVLSPTYGLNRPQRETGARTRAPVTVQTCLESRIDP
jgi:hypothetical protein